MHRLILVATLVASLTAVAAPMRVAVAPAPTSREADNPSAMLLNYLLERLEEADDAIVATPAWTQAVLAAFSSSRVRAPEDGLLAMVREQLPVDAIIRLVEDHLELHMQDGVHRWPLPETSAGMRELAMQVGERLGLAQPAALKEIRYADDALFMVHYGLPSYHVPWPNSTAAYKLKILGPIRHAHPNDPYVAGELLQAAADVLKGRRPEADEMKLVMGLVPLALPTVLGTPHEASAIALLQAKQEDFTKELLQIATATVEGEISMDTLLDGELGGGQPKQAAVPLARKIGALRVLTIVAPEVAKAPLAEARRSDSAPLRDAANAIGQPVAAPEPPAPDLQAVRADAVLAALRQPLATNDREAAIRLANTPYPPIAQAARQALDALRPEAPEAADRFDLQIAHPYLRKRLLERRHDDVPFLVEACANLDPPTRADALRLLVAADPEQASGPLQQALGDPWLWVRLHAASLLAQLPAAADEALLRRSLEAETDPAIRQLLLLALGEAEPGPTARDVKEHPNLLWMCGYGSDAVNSPFGAYYTFTPNVTPLWREAYDAGKIFFSRLSPIGNPGTIVTDPRQRDAYWLALLSQLSLDALPYIDGVVYGEETMRMTASDLWETGWHLFCADAGLDPARVDGDLEKLTQTEREAWLYWARARCIDGFNELHDFTKLYFGALRPGLQVATFLPEEVLLKDGTYPPDRHMRFDVVGIYDYKGCNRLAGYWLVRRLKTLWPDRPVLWLSLGIGGYEMNPVRHDHRPPTLPLQSRAQRAYADAISAWLAGAQAGWFSVWIFVAPDFQAGRSMSGVQVNVEDISDTALLRRGAAHAFRGVVDTRMILQDAKHAPTLGDDVATDDMGFELEDKPDPRKLELEKIKLEEAALVRGMQLYQKYVYDCARVIGELPARPEREPVLLIRDGISVWSRDGDRPVVPGFGLFHSGDFLCGINQIPYLDLSRYRVIGIHDPARLRDETIEALTNWLRTTDGTLYIHRDLTSDKRREMPTPDDLDGLLSLSWPWEAQMRILPQEPQKATGPYGDVQIVATIEGGESLASIDGKSVLARWQHPDYKGVVIVDGLSKTTDAWLDVLATHIPVGGKPYFVQRGETEGLTLTAASRYYREAREAFSLGGQDFLTGEASPEITTSSSGSIASESFVGRHVIVHHGITILADQPYDAVERLPDGVKVTGGGLLQIRLTSGAAPTVTPQTKLPPIEAPLDLILSPTAIGITTTPPTTEPTITWLRTNHPITIQSPE